MKNESGLLLAPTVLNNSAPTAEKTMVDYTLLDLPGILTIEKGNESIIPKRPT